MKSEIVFESAWDQNAIRIPKRSMNETDDRSSFINIYIWVTVGLSLQLSVNTTLACSI